MHYMFQSNARNMQCHKLSITSKGNIMHYFPKPSVL